MKVVKLLPFVRPVKMAVASLALEGLAVLIFAGWGGITLINDPASSATTAVALLVLLAVFAAGLGGAAFGIHRGYRTARSLAVTWQIFQIATGVWLAVNGYLWLGLALVLFTVLVFRYLFAADTISHTIRTIS